MTPHDLATLKARVLAAMSNGQQIAKAQAYIDFLGGMKAPVGLTPGSVAHLKAAIDAYEKGSLPEVTSEPETEDESPNDSKTEDKPKKRVKKRK